MKKTFPVIFLAILFFLPSICLAAGVIGLPKTGQTISYAAGDDGDIEAGKAWPDPRFIDNGDGTITDNMTGLMWLKDANPGMALFGGAGFKTWQETLDTVAAINNGTKDMSPCKDYTANYTDWRLPNINEFTSLLNAGNKNFAAWLNSQGFFNASDTGYWTSTSANLIGISSPDKAWAMNSAVQSGYLQITDKNSNTRCTWLVRGKNAGPCKVAKTGQNICYDTDGNVRPCAGTGEDGEFQKGVAWPDPRFIDNGDGTVTDNLTGLMWLKDISGLGSDTWSADLVKVSDLNTAPENFRGLLDYTANYNDWRMPNKNEIMSIVDYSAHLPNPVSILPLNHPFVHVVSGGLAYWLSSSWLQILLTRHGALQLNTAKFTAILKLKTAIYGLYGASPPARHRPEIWTETARLI